MKYPEKKNMTHPRVALLAVSIRMGCCCLLVFLFAGRLSAQGHDWWANNVNWDGQTHWSRYIVSSPRLLGPNALPIPLQNNGRIAQQHRLQLTANAHFAQGDRTANPRLFLDYVLVPNKISFQLNLVPVEYFRMSHARKTERRVFHTFYDAEYAVGDVQLHTNIQLLEANRHFADARLRLGYRFASSSLQGAARFTDAPGYFFDLGVAKAFAKKNLEIRPSLMLGFYVWQTNRADQFQNDAFLYGAALDINWKDYQLHSSFRGYIGYLNDGDRPGTIDLRLSRRLKRFQISLGGGVGLWDNLYHRLELGSSYSLNAT
ncbi:MAG TPA: hypothetical protein VJ953_05455 [Saprospiraceae bacterium]|nr:hypothetical protein [Saprospiraceae bacterium]